MRKVFVFTALILALAIASGASLAQFDSKLIQNAKQALTLMSYGEYKKALKKLDFGSNAPSAKELGEFVEENMPEILTGDVQSSVAVAYFNGDYWQVCIPVEEPCYDSVTTFVLRSKNGTKVNGMKTMLWYEVMDESSEAQNVVWQDEYREGDMFVVADELIKG